MFLDSSRYYNQKTVDAITKDGRIVKALTLRILPKTTGKLTAIKGNDRLDIMAQRQYGNPTMFWHIADANTKLHASDLLKKESDKITVISVPES